MKITKGQAISNSIKATRKKRKLQTCRVFEIKIDKSHLNYTTEAHLNRVFLEAKWFYNYILSHEDIFELNQKFCKITTKVPIKVKDEFKNKKLKCLSSHMKQCILVRAKNNIIGLARKKEKGIKVGALEFKSFVNSIPLQQFGNTYKILDEKYIHIQGIKQKLRVNGLNQIPKKADISNANLIHKNGDYYLKITTYTKKKEFHPKKRTLGIDFGIKKQAVLSNGIAVEYSIPISPKLRKLARRLSKKELHSSNWYKSLTKLRKEYQEATNIKTDIKNKFVSHLKDNYKNIVFQDENLQFWQYIFGKRMLSTSIGGIISALKRKAHTPIEVDKWYPSTKTCSCCGHVKKKNRLSMRTYKCRMCGLKIDRDLNASLNIKSVGRMSVGMEYTEFKPVEIKPSTFASLEYLNSIPYVKASLIAETGSHHF